MGEGWGWVGPPLPRWADAAAARRLQPRALSTRRRLLVAASVLINEHGYHGAALREVVDASGDSKGALYFHFESKHALAEALVAEVFASWDDLVARIEALRLDPLRTVMVCHDAYAGRLMFDVLARATLRVVQDEVGRHHAESWATRWEKVIGDLLVEARTLGVLRGGVDAEWLGKHLLAVTQGQFQLAEGKPGGPSMWERMDQTWTGLLPAITTPEWLAAWRASGWEERRPPSAEDYRPLDSL